MIPVSLPSRQPPTWQRALQEAVTDPPELLDLLGLGPEWLEPARAAVRRFPLRVPRGFVARMRRGDPRDPLLLQVLPAAEELDDVAGYRMDPVGDLAARTGPGMLHKYAGRALLITTGACEVVASGELRSRKGLNLPGIDLGISAFTDRDRECLAFALSVGVDALSQSFVATGADVQAVRVAAARLGHRPFVIAKIERAIALEHVDDILDAADGVMIARGDLGVEIPIEQIAVVQKGLTRKAHLRGKPVITATQMLESMIASSRPTRAEATDVANAVYDGTDAVMLSGESAVGQYPVEAVAMLGRIAREVEPFRPGAWVRQRLHEVVSDEPSSATDVLALSIESAV